jgi:hypothetical protein
MNEETRILQHAAVLAQAVDRIAHLRKYGTFSERNPALGKMTRCPYCRVRRREFGPKCCSAFYRVENSNAIARAAFVRKRKKPRLTRNRPPLFLVHQLLVDIENDRRPDLENVARKHLPGYVEKFVLDGIKGKKRRARNQQKKSRSINRGK